MIYMECTLNLLIANGKAELVNELLLNATVRETKYAIKYIVTNEKPINQ